MKSLLAQFGILLGFGVGITTMASAATPSDQVTSLPELGKPQTAQYAGYVSVGPEHCKKSSCAKSPALYYWLMTAKGDYRHKPLIIWSNGGPGASSMYGPFFENGPYVFRDHHWQRRASSWTQVANYLVIEQPLSVGASKASALDEPYNNRQAARQLYWAIRHIVAKHPFLQHRRIYLAGESYAGTSLAYLAMEIINENVQHPHNPLALKGMILNDIWVNPVVQQGSDAEYAWSHGLVTQAQEKTLKTLYQHCRQAIDAQRPSSVTANNQCALIGSMIRRDSGRYLLNIDATAPNYQPLTAYLSRHDVQRALHMKPMAHYPLFSNAIGKRFTLGEQDSVAKLYDQLLTDHIKILMMSGLLDATDCNFLGMAAMIHGLHWPGEMQYSKATTQQWRDPKTHQVLGYQKTGGDLTWVKVLNGGHMLVMDQPKVIQLVQKMIA